MILLTTRATRMRIFGHIINSSLATPNQHTLGSRNAITHTLIKLVLNHFEIVVWLKSFILKIMNVFILLNK